MADNMDDLPSNLSMEEMRQKYQELMSRTKAAETRADNAEDRAEKEKHRADTAQERIRNTTFEEYLETCHQFITAQLSVETRAEYTTKGSITSPRGRLCPTFLRIWDFRTEQQPLFDEVNRFFHPDATGSADLQVFPSFPILEDRGHQSNVYPLSSEADLVQHQLYEVEIPVREVFERLRQIPEANERFALGEGIGFQTHQNGLIEVPDVVEETQAKDAKLAPRTDQNCVFLRADNLRHLLYIVEYKAAHKLTDAYICGGLREMNMWEEIVQDFTVPKYRKKGVDLSEEELAQKLKHNAETLSCAAATQAFEYMIKAGLEFGILTNGAIKVMLRIAENDPTTLQYCILQPKTDAVVNEGGSPHPDGFQYAYTAIASYVCFTLMALQAPQRSQAWRNSTIENLHRWEVDFDSLVRKIPDDEREQEPPDSAYRGPRPINPRSPYLLRKKKKTAAGCSKDTPINLPRDESDHDSDDPPHEPPSSPIQAREKRRRTGGNQNQGKNKPLPPAHHRPPPPNDQYCTQKCLKGLSYRSAFDPACPNVDIHRKHSNNQRHPINRAELLRKIQRQLNLDPDHGCKPLGKEGLHGAMFSLTLHPYGYTFLGKGTTYNSDYEGRVYEHLKHLQGSAVPVYLGEIYLRDMVYYLRPDYVIIHMGLMAWGGKDLGTDCPRETDDIERTRNEITAAGVIQLDERGFNMLWNEEVGRILYIDFGRAKIRPGYLKRKTNLNINKREEGLTMTRSKVH